MPHRILISSTSFFDTSGPHTEALEKADLEISKVRGPLTEHELLAYLNENGLFDGYLIGEDQFSQAVLEFIAPRAKVISRYGVGLDKIDLEAATRLGIPVTNTPGVNHTTVTELTFGLLFSLARNICEQNNLVHKAQWRRITGTELCHKTIGICGFGRVGREVARRALAFGMNVLVFNTSWSEEQEQEIHSIIEAYSHPVFGEIRGSIQRCPHIDDLIQRSDVITLHMSLTKHNVRFLNTRRLALARKGALIVNVSRGALVDQNAMAEAIKSGHIGGFAADVLDPEPITEDNPLLGLPRVVLTPHIGSRTTESITRQGLAAVKNLLMHL